MAHVLGMRDAGNVLEYHGNDVFGYWQSKSVAIISFSTWIACNSHCFAILLFCLETSDTFSFQTLQNNNVETSVFCFMSVMCYT